jgi:hypothetical protein
MPMDSLEFKQLIADFGQDLKAISERLYEAVQGELTETDGEGAVAAARAKLAAYDELLADPRLDAVKQSQVTNTFGERVERIRDRLTRLPLSSR